MKKWHVQRLLMPMAVVALVAACAGSSPAPQQQGAPAAGSALDGKSFAIVITIPGEVDEKDTLNFSGGKFESTACTTLGFPKWTPYQASSSGGAAGFAVVTRHPDGTTMDWRGSVKGDTVEGTLIRTMGGKAASGRFKGSRIK